MKKGLFAAVLLVLLAVLIIQQAPTSTSQQLPTLPTFKLAEVVQFEIKERGEIKLQARKEGEKWLLSGTDATTLKVTVVEQLLLDLQHMQAKRIASKKAENHFRFSVADQNLSVLLSNAKGEALLNVMVGKPATDLRSTYIRLVGEDTVVTVDKILTWQLKRTKQAWLNEEKTPE